MALYLMGGRRMGIRVMEGRIMDGGEMDGGGIQKQDGGSFIAQGNALAAARLQADLLDHIVNSKLDNGLFRVPKGNVRIQQGHHGHGFGRTQFHVFPHMQDMGRGEVFPQQLAQKILLGPAFQVVEADRGLLLLLFLQAFFIQFFYRLKDPLPQILFQHRL